jgi:hypothetical protein
LLEALFCGFYILTLLLSVAQVRGSLSAETDKHRVAIKVALCSVLLTAPLSVFHIFQHLAQFLHPHLQSQVVRIIWMVPVYAVQVKRFAHDKEGGSLGCLFVLVCVGLCWFAWVCVGLREGLLEAS